MNQGEFFSSAEVLSENSAVLQNVQTTRTPRVLLYKQKRIVYIDFSDLKKTEEIYELMDKSSKFISKNLPKSVLTMTNLTGMYFNRDVYNHFISYVKGNNPYVKYSAVFGMNGLMQIFYNAFVALTGRDVKAFSSEFEAREFLASR